VAAVGRCERDAIVWDDTRLAKPGCLVGLAPTAAQFSFFLALVTLATLVAESYVVMVGTLLSDEKAAALVAPLLLALMMASGGFFVSHASTPPLFHALNTVNLFRYAYAGLLRNELTGLSFRCGRRAPPASPSAPRASAGWPGSARRGGARAHGRLGPDAGSGVRRARAHGPRLPRRRLLGVAPALPLAVGVASKSPRRRCCSRGARVETRAADCKNAP